MDYKQQARKERLEKVATFKEGEKLIFEWVKTGEVTVAQFSELCDYNRKLESQG